MKDYQARSALFQAALRGALQNAAFLRPAGRTVQGFGASHTVDSVDLAVFPAPFAPPVRIVSEYRCHATRIDPEQLLDLSGLLKDLDDRSRAVPDERYWNAACFFSATGFTAAAQEYAWAQGILLLSFEQSRLMLPTIGSIRSYVRSITGELAELPAEELLAGYREMRLHRYHNQNFNSPTLALAALEGSYPVLFTGEGEWFSDLVKLAGETGERVAALSPQEYGDELEVRVDFQLAGHALEFCVPGMILKRLLGRRGSRPLRLEVPYLLPAQGGELRRFLTVELPLPQWEQFTI